jgi:hypothetical protein
MAQPFLSAPAAPPLLDHWPTNGLPVVWKRWMGSGYSASLVPRNQVVVHHRIQDAELCCHQSQL